MKILYIDREPSNQMIVDDMLAAAGLFADHASTISSALDIVAKMSFGLYLIDLQTSGLEGIVATRRKIPIDDRSRARSGRVVVVTSDRTLLTRARCLQAGADDVIIKPIAMDALMTVVAAAMIEWDPATGGNK